MVICAGCLRNFDYTENSIKYQTASFTISICSKKCHKLWQKYSNEQWGYDYGHSVIMPSSRELNAEIEKRQREL